MENKITVYSYENCECAFISFNNAIYVVISEDKEFDFASDVDTVGVANVKYVEGEPLDTYLKTINWADGKDIPVHLGHKTYMSDIMGISPRTYLEVYGPSSEACTSRMHPVFDYFDPCIHCVHCDYIDGVCSQVTWAEGYSPRGLQ